MEQRNRFYGDGAHKASLDLFEEAGMENIFKRDALNWLFRFIINRYF